MRSAIRVEKLSKRYRIGTRQGGDYRTLRETIAGAAAGVWRPLRARARRLNAAGDGQVPADPDDLFWALRDVEFEVQPGEVVGIIGRNGAGKSTLLKILSRITEPTSGRVEILGRIGSLLEVGTGFHPELTGRENIYLNGSILGMSRSDVARQFDEIVAFAEIEKFLDTPVKRYSSGMYVRLAFAVASHLETETLIIDEVLAVGDLAFQKKCLGKMGEVGRSGRTVLFVSHNNAAIEALCDRCLLLSSGRLLSEGPTEEILSEYCKLGIDSTTGRSDLSIHPGRTGNSTWIMTEVVLGDGSVGPVGRVRMGSRLSVTVLYDLASRRVKPVLGVAIKSGMGAPIFGVNNRFIPGYDFETQSTTGTITCHLDRLPLMPALYTIDLFFGDEHRDLDVIHDAIQFEVTETDVFGSGKIPPHAAGPIFWPATWEVVSSRHE